MFYKSPCKRMLGRGWVMTSLECTWARVSIDHVDGLSLQILMQRDIDLAGMSGQPNRHRGRCRRWARGLSDTRSERVWPASGGFATGGAGTMHTIVPEAIAASVTSSKPAGSVHGHVEEPGPQTSNVCSTSNISAAVGLRPVNCSNSAATSSASGFRTNVISVFLRPDFLLRDI
jgi:hypothetical protein